MVSDNNEYSSIIKNITKETFYIFNMILELLRNVKIKLYLIKI